MKKLIESCEMPLTYGSTLGLEEETLTDGSKVRNVVLFDANENESNIIRIECADHAQADRVFAFLQHIEKA